MAVGQGKKAFGKCCQPALLNVRQRQCQREAHRFGAAGRQIAQVDGQRFVAQGARVHVSKKMPALNQHVSGDSHVRSGRRLHQRAVVANAQHRAACRTLEEAFDQVKFTHKLSA